MPLLKVNSTTKPVEYYSAIKNHPMLLKCYESGSETTLGLKITLFVPKRLGLFNIVGVIKPMIDGVLCAFHTPKGIDTEKVSKLLSIDKEILLSKNNTCIGECCYVSPYRNSVKWNPQDDRLDFVHVESVMVEDENVSFSGEIYAVPHYM